jgi:hypothetical protein
MSLTLCQVAFSQYIMLSCNFFFQSLGIACNFSIIEIGVHISSQVLLDCNSLQCLEGSLCFDMSIFFDWPESDSNES